MVGTRLIRSIIFVALSGSVAVLTACTTGCAPQTTLPDMVSGDWQPPMLSKAVARTPQTLALEFDEPVTAIDVAIEPAVEIVGTRWRNAALEIEGATPFLATTEYWVDARVEDDAGNMSSVLAGVYGLNERLPALRLSEFVCEGSSSHPDWVELEVLSDGNIAGACLYEGSPAVWDSRIVLPSVEVVAGEFITVHFKPEMLPEEINETTSTSESGGRDVHPDAWDLWVSGGDGIPNTTGALTLTQHPGGPVIDAVLYTTKRYDANDEKRGFGLVSQLETFESVVAIGGWKIAGEFVIPEDGIDPEDSTATRSICRDPGAPDTDTAADWHITPTSGATPGYPNTTERYTP